MRLVLSLPVLLLSAAAIAEAPPPAFDRSPAVRIDSGSARGLPQALDMSPALRLSEDSAKGLPNALDGSPALKLGAKAVCRDRIEQVREERGLPRLKRDDTSSDKPLLTAAVDKRIGGCEVLVMRNNLSDIRPLPAPAGPARMRPAH